MKREIVILLTTAAAYLFPMGAYASGMINCYVSAMVSNGTKAFSGITSTDLMGTSMALDTQNEQSYPALTTSGRLSYDSNGNCKENSSDGLPVSYAVQVLDNSHPEDYKNIEHAESISFRIQAGDKETSGQLDLADGGTMHVGLHLQDPGHVLGLVPGGNVLSDVTLSCTTKN